MTEYVKEQEYCDSSYFAPDLVLVDKVACIVCDNSPFEVFYKLRVIGLTFEQLEMFRKIVVNAFKVCSP